MLKKVGMVAVFAVLSACGGGGENTVGPGGVASVALNAPSLSMLPGLSDQLTAAMNKSNLKFADLQESMLNTASTSGFSSARPC